jgi:hypothetical protein
MTATTTPSHRWGGIKQLHLEQPILSEWGWRRVVRNPRKFGFSSDSVRVVMGKYAVDLEYAPQWIESRCPPAPIR